MIKNKRRVRKWSLLAESRACDLVESQVVRRAWSNGPQIKQSPNGSIFPCLILKQLFPYGKEVQEENSDVVISYTCFLSRWEGQTNGEAGPWFPGVKLPLSRDCGQCSARGKWSNNPAKAATVERALSNKLLSTGSLNHQHKKVHGSTTSPVLCLTFPPHFCASHLHKGRMRSGRLEMLQDHTQHLPMGEKCPSWLLQGKRNPTAAAHSSAWASLM